MSKQHLYTSLFVLMIGALLMGCQPLNTAEAAAPAVDNASPQRRITANTVSHDPNDVNSYRAFAPELASTVARMPQIDPETGVYVEEVKQNLFYVTEGVYQSAFLKTDEGVIVFDAPPSFAHVLPDVIQQHAPDVPVSYLLYSHGHTDHVGGASVFSDVEGLQIVANQAAAESIEERANPGILLPTITFEDEYNLTLGGETIEMTTTSYHAEDADTFIYLPKQKFILAVDTITPGEVPFMNFGATSDVGEYLKSFDKILEYDFDTILSGHLGILGTRDDVLQNKAYALDVQASVLQGMQNFDDQFNETFAAFEYENANLGYRSVIEQIRDECSAEIIDTWSDELSVVDVWADSHCETMIMYYIMH